MALMTSRALVSVIVASVIIAVLFIDFLSVPLRGYADQRLLLLSLPGLLTLLAGQRVLIGGTTLVQSRDLWPILPGLGLANLFLLLPFPYLSQSFNWVEPGMYASYFLVIVLGGVYLARTRQTTPLIEIFACIAAIACFFYGAMTINVYLFAMNDSVANLVNYIPWGFVNIRYWSHIATWLLPLLPLAVLAGPYKDQRLWRAGVALAAALWWWIVLMSSARGTMMGVIFGSVFACLLFGRPALPWLKTFLKYLVLGGCAWLLLSVLIPSLLLDEIHVRSLKADSSGRMPLFREAFQMSLQNFPFGMGPQSWLTHEIITDEYRNSPKFGHPHNMYLMWAAEYGWLLIGGLLVLVGQAARYLWAKRKLVRSGLAPDLTLPLVAFTASVSAALAHAGVSAVFMAPGSMLIGLLVLTLFWALIQPPVPVEHHAKPYRKVGRFAVLVIFAAATVLYGFWLREAWHYYKAMEEDVEYYQENVSGGTQPRFWFHGNFPRHPDQMPPGSD